MKFLRKMLLAMILLGVVVLLFSHFKPDAKEDSLHEGEIGIIDTIDTSRYTTLSKTKSDIAKGELILVNHDTPYPFAEDTDQLVRVYEYKNSSYMVKDLNVSLHQSVMEPLNDMLKDFQNQYSTDALTVISGHRTFDYQESLYNQSTEKNGEIEAMKWIARPGCSEHHTGYALDFGLYHADGRSESYEGRGPYKWINENAWRYGFIVRYPEDKKEQTGIEYEPWHFRYIGRPHSYIAAKYDMCLEEYITYLKQYQYGKKHLKIMDIDGIQYEIYYTNQLEIPVPLEGSYKISGNNLDGFIVTVRVQ